MTWSTFVPASSFTVPMLSGECGLAMSGSTAPRSSSMTRSYFASASAASAVQSDSRFCALRNACVISSLGKTEVVTPSSAPMFVIVARSGTERVLTPSPPYSMTVPTLPLVVRSLEDREDHVLGRDPGPEPSGEVHLHDLGTGEVEGTAAHGNGHVEPARADGDHADARRPWAYASRTRAASCPACRSAPGGPGGRCRCLLSNSGCRTSRPRS